MSISFLKKWIGEGMILIDICHSHWRHFLKTTRHMISFTFLLFPLPTFQPQDCVTFWGTLASQFLLYYLPKMGIITFDLWVFSLLRTHTFRSCNFPYLHVPQFNRMIKIVYLKDDIYFPSTIFNSFISPRLRCSVSTNECQMSSK